MVRPSERLLARQRGLRSEGEHSTACLSPPFVAALRASIIAGTNIVGSPGEADPPVIVLIEPTMPEPRRQHHRLPQEAGLLAHRFAAVATVTLSTRVECGFWNKSVGVGAGHQGTEARLLSRGA